MQTSIIDLIKTLFYSVMASVTLNIDIDVYYSLYCSLTQSISCFLLLVFKVI